MLVEQERGLCRRLDALGDDAEPEVVRHRDQRAHDRGILRVVCDLADEEAVNLDARYRIARQIAQRRVAGAEVVEGELDAPFVQLLQGRDCFIVIERDGLGDFQFERIGRQGGFHQNLFDIHR